MPTYKSTLELFARRSSKVLTSFVGKREQLKTDGDGNTYPTGVRLGITDRANLLDLKDTIDKILDDCKDDGY